MPEDTISTVDAVSTARAVLSRALAAALILGIDNASEEDHPLTQVQQIDMATMSIMTYYDAVENFDLITKTGAKLFNMKVT